MHETIIWTRIKCKVQLESNILLKKPKYFQIRWNIFEIFRQQEYRILIGQQSICVFKNQPIVFLDWDNKRKIVPACFLELLWKSWQNSQSPIWAIDLLIYFLPKNYLSLVGSIFDKAAMFWWSQGMHILEEDNFFKLKKRTPPRPLYRKCLESFIT